MQATMVLSNASVLRQSGTLIASLCERGRPVRIPAESDRCQIPRYALATTGDRRYIDVAPRSKSSNHVMPHPVHLTSESLPQRARVRSARACMYPRSKLIAYKELRRMKHEVRPHL